MEVALQMAVVLHAEVVFQMAVVVGVVLQMVVVLHMVVVGVVRHVVEVAYHTKHQVAVENVGLEKGCRFGSGQLRHELVDFEQVGPFLANFQLN